MGCIVIGSGALLAMKLWPVYNEKMKVDQAMEHLGSNPDAARMSKSEVVQALMRQFDVSDVDRFDTPSLSKVVTVGKKKGSNQKVVMIEYEIRAPLFANLDVIMNYRNVKEFGPVATD
jgi:ABC-type glucose/galactose transport system permease subunit